MKKKRKNKKEKEMEPESWLVVPRVIMIVPQMFHFIAQEKNEVLQKVQSYDSIIAEDVELK